MNNLETFGKVIWNARRAAGLSSRELAKKIGIDYIEVSKLENGNLLPRQEIVIKLAKELISFIAPHELQHFLDLMQYIAEQAREEAPKSEPEGYEGQTNKSNQSSPNH